MISRLAPHESIIKNLVTNIKVGEMNLKIFVSLLGLGEVYINIVCVDRKLMCLIKFQPFLVLMDYIHNMF